jgi:hypothetical protein
MTHEEGAWIGIILDVQASGLPAAFDCGRLLVLNSPADPFPAFRRAGRVLLAAQLGPW